MTAIVLTHLGMAAVALSLFKQFCTEVREAGRHHGAFEDGQPW